MMTALPQLESGLMTYCSWLEAGKSNNNRQKPEIDATFRINKTIFP